MLRYDKMRAGTYFLLFYLYYYVFLMFRFLVLFCCFGARKQECNNAHLDHRESRKISCQNELISSFAEVDSTALRTTSCYKYADE